MKPTVYLETTIPSYLTGWPSRNLIRAAEQQLTRDWWAVRHEYDLRVSPVVLAECAAGDPQAAADRLAALAGVIVLLDRPEVETLTALLMRDARLPAKAAADAAHIATSAVHGINFLLTWNCRHISNVVLRPRIEAVCRLAGYEPPVICTPRGLLAEEDGSWALNETRSPTSGPGGTSSPDSTTTT